MAMELLGLDDIDALAPAWDRAAAVTANADPFCATTVWSFAAAHSFDMAGPPVIATNGDAHAGFRPVDQDGTRLLLGLDPIWGFATPVVGPSAAVADVVRAALDAHNFDMAVITGQHVDSTLTHAIAAALDGDHGLFVGPTEQRLRIDLTAGVDSWFARRSPRFRQRIRRVERDAATTGIAIETLDPGSDGWFDRLLAIEAESWKGLEESGLSSPDLQRFYRDLCHRLQGVGAVHAHVARLDDRDVGYLLGGSIDRTYRGLQLSYVADAESSSIGHLLQAHQLRLLDDAPIDTYDLGMDMEYKRRWCDRIDETFALIVRND